MNWSKSQKIPLSPQKSVFTESQVFCSLNQWFGSARAGIFRKVSPIW
jgi:hypothetical protein